MKKLLLIALVSFAAFTATAQGNGKNKQKKAKSEKVERDSDDRYEKDRKDRGNDDRYERERKDRNNDDRYERERRDRDNRGNDQILNESGKYSKNTPRKVSDAFNRDFPNATSVSWTKNQGSWTANYRNGGILGGSGNATYRANGQRVDAARRRSIF